MAAPTTIDPALFRHLSVYQDVRIDGQTVVPGERDCETRWQAMAPYLNGGTLLDIGSNFGWFGLRWRETFAEANVVSVEADLRSALVQRTVLAANRAERMFLLTAKANTSMLEHWQQSGQRFDTVLLLSILHWIRDHRGLLAALGPMAGRIFVEQPHPDEQGAGIAQLRREIGPIGPYLGELFPDRAVVHLASWPSHRNSQHLRELWMVAESADWQPTRNALQLTSLLDLEPAWPPRSWWQSQAELQPWAARLASIPESGVTTFARRCRRVMRGIWGRLRRWV